MNVPIQRHGSCLIASICTALADGDLLDLRDTLVKQVARSHPQVVIVDVAGLDVLDSFATRTLGELAAKIRHRGAEMVLVGIQPEVAVAAGRLGLKLDSIASVLGLDEGLAYLHRKAGAPAKYRGAPG